MTISRMGLTARSGALFGNSGPFFFQQQFAVGGTLPHLTIVLDMSADADEPFTVSSNPIKSLRFHHRALVYYAAFDLEKLRKDFPETIFVCIHQKTTAGTIRGGSKIFYNSTAIINIEIDHDKGRLAVMKKSRYGTEGYMYNINDDEVFRAGDW